jgi:uncharacterized protein YcbK (DUF882 family)
MPTIPVYNREVSLDPQFTEMNTVRATPEAFGAAIGRGLQDVGQGIDQISKAKFTLEAKLQENEGRAAVLRYESSKNQSLLDPDVGILNRSGVNARGAAKAWQDKAAELRAAAAEGLTGAGLEYFNRIVDQDVVQTSGTVLSHEAGEMKKGLDQSFVSLIDTYAENAVTYLNDPVASSVAIDNGIQMIRERAATQGWDKATSDNLVAQFMSDTHKNIALTIASTDPLKAQAYIDENREEMTAEGSNYQAVTAVLREAVTLKQADRAATGFFTTSRPGVDVDNVGDAAKARFTALQEAWGKPLTITSGYRDPEYNEKVGGANDSQHTHGNAFDVDVSGMSIEERQQLIVAARQAGFAGVGVYDNSLHFDVAGERAWGEDYTSATVPEWAKEALVTPAGAGGGTTTPATGGAGGGAPINVMDPAAIETYVSSLPADVQDLTRKKIYSYFDNMAKAETANRANAKQALWDTILETGAMPTDVSVLSAAGMEAVSSAQTYLDKGGAPSVTDETEFRKLTELKAADREAFVKVDLNEYRLAMTEADFSALQKDQRTMLEQGAAQLDFKVAHDLSKQVVEAQIGPAPSTSDAEDRREYDARLNALYRTVEADMRAYQQANKVVPLYDDILKMVTARTLPTVEAEDTWGLNDDTGMQFEMSDPSLGKLFKLDAEAIVPRIPLDIYNLIIADLNAQGVPQTPEEIASAYENYLLWETVNSND